MTFRTLIRALPMLTMLALSACGGSSSPTPVTPPPANSKTGTFIDALVAGIDIFVDGEKIGSTNASGEFSYPEGKTVTFKVGKVTLGSSSNPAVVTPGDLSASPVAVLNILKFLQTLDQDGNPSNGIVLAADKVAQITSTINLSQSDAGGLTSALQGVSVTAIVSDADALAHFAAAFATGHAINSSVEQAASALVGIWQFSCNGQGKSQMIEFERTGATVRFAKLQSRNYANANCSGGFVDTPVVTFADTGLKLDILGAIVNAGGSIDVFGVSSSLTKPITQESFKLVPGQTITMPAAAGWTNVKKVDNFAFPALPPSALGTLTVTAGVGAGETYALRSKLTINGAGLLTGGSYDFHTTAGGMTPCEVTPANIATCFGSSSNYGAPAASYTFSATGANPPQVLTTGQDQFGFTFTGTLTGTVWSGTWTKVAVPIADLAQSGTFSAEVVITVQ
ncbi:MAG: hypothetical protein V4484_05970 [Pseudomonadota bacterium]